MELFAPRYFEKFKCIAEKCRHNCCIGWEIDIDSETAARYRTLSGEIGAEIRCGMVSGEDGAHFALAANGRCALLDDRGLCKIITALGESALCEICREHPRFYNTVGGHMEVGLGAVCEEAARLMLEEADPATLCRVGEVEAAEAAPAEIDTVAVRQEILGMLLKAEQPYVTRLSAIATRYQAPTLPQANELQELLLSLEYLDEAHRTLLANAVHEVVPCEETALSCARFFAYLLHRHVAPARTVGELSVALGLALLLERIFRALVCDCGLSPVLAAGVVSEELEYSEENTDALRFELEMRSL